MAEGINKKKQDRSKSKSLYYKHVQPSRTEKNKTKKVLRHFKSNPTCEQTVAYLTAKGYKLDTVARTSKGRKVEGA